MRVGCSKEPSHQDSFFEYPQQMFWMRNKDNSFPISTLIWRPVDLLKAEAMSCYFLGDAVNLAQHQRHDDVAFDVAPTLWHL